MKPNRTIKAVFIKKSFDPLIIENYIPVGSANTRLKLRLEMTQWELYADVKKEFLETHEKVRLAMQSEEGVPARLAQDYRDIKAKFFINHLAVNEEFSKYAS
jgi:hypothetical protein